TSTFLHIRGISLLPAATDRGLPHHFYTMPISFWLVFSSLPSYGDLFPGMELFRRDQHLSRFAPLIGTDHSPAFHEIDQPGRPRITDAQTALQHRSGGCPRLHHEPNRLRIQLVVHRLLFLRLLHVGDHLLVVPGFLLLFDELNHRLHLPVG